MTSIQYQILGVFIHSARRLGHVIIDPVRNGLVVNPQFSRNRAEGLSVEAQQDGFAAQVIGITIRVWLRGVLAAAGFAQIALAAGKIPASSKLVYRFLATGALGHG
jgi:hypothetical protein